MPAEGFSRKTKEAPKIDKADATPPGELTRAEWLDKLRVAIVDIDALKESQARDRAERSLTASAESMKGVSGFFKKIWTHGIMREPYRQAALREARKAIKESGNLYAAEDPAAARASHDAAAASVVERFVSDYEEAQHEGEKRRELGKSLGDERLSSKESEDMGIKSEINSIIKDYVTGKMDDSSFNEAKKRVLARVSRADSAKKDAMYADNLLEVAQNAKKALEHGIGLDKLDEALKVVVGKAEENVQSAANHHFVDKLIDRVQKSWVGNVVSEATIASALAITVGVSTYAARRLASSRAAAWVSFGGSAFVGGAFIGWAENKRIKEDRRQHAREMAQGRKYEKGSPRREEMEKYRHNTREVSELTAGLREAIGKGKEPRAMSREDAVRAYEQLAEIEARIKLMNLHKIDLLAYSDATKVEEERKDLDIARGEAKAALRKFTGDAAIDGKGMDDRLARQMHDWMGQLTNGDGGIEEKNRRFQQMKFAHVAKAAAKGAFLGMALGAVGQEAFAQVGLTDAQGLFDSPKGPGTMHVTPLEGLHQYIKGLLPPEKLHDVALGVNHFKLPESMTLVASPHGGLSLTQGHTTLAEHLYFGKDGAPDAATAKLLGEHGIGVTSTVVSTMRETPMTWHSAKDYLNYHHMHGTTHVSRDLWYDNDTPKPVFDLNEKKLWWGPNHNSGLDDKGWYTFSMSHMKEAWSFHGGEHAHAHELLGDNRLKLLLSLTQGTQAHPFEVPVDPDGSIHIDPHSEIGKLFFTTDKLGKPHFIGRFAEIAQDTGTHGGADHVKILATYEGHGHDNIQEVIRAHHDTPYTTLHTPKNYVIDPPPALPIFGRTPLEPVSRNRNMNERAPLQAKKTERPPPARLAAEAPAPASNQQSVPSRESGIDLRAPRIEVQGERRPVRRKVGEGAYANYVERLNPKKKKPKPKPQVKRGIVQRGRPVPKRSGDRTPRIRTRP